MVELNSEELKCIEELDSIRNRGENVKRFIEHRLYAELSHKENEDDLGEYEFVKHQGFDEQYGTYVNIAGKGLLESSKYSHSATMSFGDLTSEGRCYLSDKEACDKEAKRAKWSERRFTIAASLITCIVSAVLGYIAGHI